MAAEKKDNQTEDRKFDFEEIKIMLEDASHPFDFDYQVRILHEHNIKRFENMRLQTAQLIIHSALHWFCKPKKSIKQFETRVDDIKHPVTDESTPEWTKQYLIKHLGPNYEVGIAHCQSSSVKYPTKTIIIRRKQ